MIGRHFFRNIGGPRYPASNSLVNVALERRPGADAGTEELLILMGDTPLAGTPLRDVVAWLTGDAERVVDYGTARVVADELETRMMRRALHYPADRCPNCDVRRLLAIIDELVPKP